MNNTTRLHPTLSVTVMLAMIVGAITSPLALHATDGTWTNTAGGTWSTSGNWSGGTIADGSGGTADFSTLNIPANETVTLDSSRTLGNLKFADTTGTSTWTITSGNASTLTLATGSGSPTLTTNTNGSINVALLGTQGFTKEGSGQLSLGGGTANTISGAILVNSGSLYVGSTNSIVNTTASITVASGATFSFFGNYQPGTMTNALTLAGTGTTGQGAFAISGNGAYNGTITLSGATTISHGGNSGTLSGKIIGDYDLTLSATYGGQPDFTVSSAIQTGTGGLIVKALDTQKIVLSGNNTYTGATTVQTGKLIVNGKLTSAVTVNSGATFGGTGSSTEAISILTGGKLTTGSIGGVGTFTTTGSVSFASGSTFSVDFNSATATFDKLIGSDFALGGATLTLNDIAGTSTTLSLGQVFTIADGTNSSISGTFAGLSEGSFVTVGGNIFRISYLADSGHDVTLTTVSAIPEPATWTLLLGAVSLLAVACRRRSRASHT